MDPTGRRGNPLAWAVYLGSSWTWCIGMFLPILLMRDYGWAGFWVFAIPNVVGAAAMGWVLRSPEQSRRFVKDHHGAVLWFTLITVWFHVFWVTWLSKAAMPMLLDPNSTEPDSGLLALGGLVLGVPLILTLVIRGKDTLAAGLVWVLSFALLATLTLNPGLIASGSIESGGVWPSEGGFPLDLVFVIPVSVFGFLLCPYLDATFHRARQEAGGVRGGRIAFTLGFGVFFALMIWLTTQYGLMLASLVVPNAGAASFPAWLGVWLVVHLALQATFTVSIHTKEMARLDRTPGVRLLLLGAGSFIAVLLGIFGSELRPTLAGTLWIGDMPGHEVIYRLFLSAYALAAPLYVLLGPVAGKRDAGRIVAWWGSTFGFVAWTFILGLIAMEEAWLTLGLAVIAGAFALMKWRGAKTRSRPA